MLIKTFIFISFIIGFCCAYRVLVVSPIPGNSHFILGQAQVDLLLKAGHEVTFVTGVRMQSTHPNLRQIFISKNENFDFSGVFNLKKIMTKEIILQNAGDLHEIMNKFANDTVTNEEVQKLIHDPNENFDVVVLEWMFNEIYSGFSFVFGCPLIWFSSMDPHALVFNLIHEYPNPAYIPDQNSDNTPPFTFWQRIKELWIQIKLRYIKWKNSGAEENIFYKEFASAVAKRGRVLPNYYEARYSASLVLANSHASSGLAMPLPQNLKEIAGYHIDENVKPLPKELQEIMDNAKNGVIYFSMGSVLNGTTFPRELIQEIIPIFKNLTQTVIWKYEEELNDVPNNVQVLKWAPQQSILAHPNCIMFISHGGLLSTTEALHFGVPMIGIPAFGDQFFNIGKAQRKGYAKVVDLNFDLPINLKKAIEEMLTDSRYQARVKELSFAYHDRLASPRKEFVYWVEHVVRTRGASYLSSPALHVPLYQKLYLDLIALIFVIVISINVLCKNIYASKVSSLFFFSLEKKNA